MTDEPTFHLFGRGAAVRKQAQRVTLARALGAQVDSDEDDDQHDDDEREQRSEPAA
jgi:hypothetical protein